MILRVKTQQYVGYDVLNLAGNPLKVIHILEGLQQAESLKKFEICKLQSNEVVSDSTTN